MYNVREFVSLAAISWLLQALNKCLLKEGRKKGGREGGKERKEGSCIFFQPKAKSVIFGQVARNDRLQSHLHVENLDMRWMHSGFYHEPLVHLGLNHQILG